MTRTFRSPFRSFLIASDRFDRKASDQPSDRFRTLPIKESLGLIGNDQNSCARAEVVLITTTYPKEQKDGFDFGFSEPRLSKPATAAAKIIDGLNVEPASPVPSGARFLSLQKKDFA